jgi:hypothetical protein
MEFDLSYLEIISPNCAGFYQYIHSLTLSTSPALQPKNTALYQNSVEVVTISVCVFLFKLYALLCTARSLHCALLCGYATEHHSCSFMQQLREMFLLLLLFLV